MLNEHWNEVELILKEQKDRLKNMILWIKGFIMGQYYLI